MSDQVFSQVDLPPEPTPLDYVRKLESRLATEKEGGVRVRNLEDWLIDNGHW